MKRTRNSDGGEFVGCSNYPFCDKTYHDVRILEDKKKCPLCKGWLTRRINTHDGSEFFGCTNSPHYCQYTISLDGVEGDPRRPSQRRWAGTGTTFTSVSTERVETWSYGPADRDDDEDVGPRCPKCGAPMALRSGPYGKFYGCTRYPQCTGKREYGSSGGSNRKSYSRQPKSNNKAPKCPKCGAPMVLRNSKRGKFYGCSKYPKCKGTRDYEG